MAIKEADKKQQKYVLREVNHFNELYKKSPHIVNIYMSTKDKDMYQIIMEYMEGGSLAEFINKHGNLDEIQV